MKKGRGFPVDLKEKRPMKKRDLQLQVRRDMQDHSAAKPKKHTVMPDGMSRSVSRNKRFPKEARAGTPRDGIPA